jgi:ATP-dependent DNA helicase RecG
MLDLDIIRVPSIGPAYAQKLQKLGIEKVRDLIFHFPHRYQDYAQVSSIDTAEIGEVVTIRGQIISIRNVFTRNGKRLQTAVVSDGESRIDVIWFNQTYIVKTLPEGTWVSLSGKVGQSGKKRTLLSPDYEKISSEAFWSQDTTTTHTGRLVPIYPETAGVSSKWIRTKISQILPKALENVDEFLPKEILEKNNLIDIKTALKDVHFPENSPSAMSARTRFAFNEFFELQLNALLRKKTWHKKKLAHKLTISDSDISTFIKSLPFPLTNAQHNALKEIGEDLKKTMAMNRLLEGDVGSGKTVIAAFACFIAFKNGYQSSVMAPTQILATQHFHTLKNLLEPLGVKISIVTSLQTKREKELAGGADLIVGTQALLHKIDFANLAVVVIDEQHRFGVTQRALLALKAGSPHVLTMTATPIPRTVALTMYGDLDLSVLDEMPKGRLQIKTWVVPPKKREGAYSWIREHVKGTDEQAFIVCPLIEESTAETLKSVRAATVEFELLQKQVFPDLRLGLLHGKIKGKEKEEIMQKMKNGEIDILVATPVVEVGIDFPNATIMLIEASERFGLAQLHQLRGRVGRGTKQSYCLLFTDSKSDRVQARLNALERNLTGAQLAELDLKMRGPGEVYGSAQSGFPELKIGSYSDLPLIKKAREAAEELLPKVDRDPKLKELLKKQDFIVPN